MQKNLEIYLQMHGRFMDCLKTRNPQIRQSRLLKLMEDVQAVYDLPNSRNKIGLELYNRIKESEYELRMEAV